MSIIFETAQTSVYYGRAKIKICTLQLQEFEQLRIIISLRITRKQRALSWQLWSIFCRYSRTFKRVYFDSTIDRVSLSCRSTQSPRTLHAPLEPALTSDASADLNSKVCSHRCRVFHGQNSYFKEKYRRNLFESTRPFATAAFATCHVPPVEGMLKECWLECSQAADELHLLRQMRERGLRVRRAKKG